MQKHTRRHFLRQGIGATLAGAAASGLTGCSGGRRVPSSAPYTPVDGTSRVVAVTGTSLASMAREALEAFGGAKTFIERGDTVFLKPNFGGAGMMKHDVIATGDSTKPEVIIAVAEACLEARAGEVIIGECSQVQSFEWSALPTLNGKTNMASEVQRLASRYPDQIRLACLEVDSPAWVPLPSPYSGLKTISVSSLITRANKIISLPVIKTHRFTQMTGAIKNFVGITSCNQYGPGNWLPVGMRTGLHYSPCGIEQCFIDIVKALKPHFAIADLSVCCEGDGPHVMDGWWGSTIDVASRLGHWVVLASDDLAAVDATAARIIGLGVESVEHLLMAYGQGLGQIQKDKIRIDGARLDDMRMHWTPAKPANDFMDVMIPGLMMLLGS